MLLKDDFYRAACIWVSLTMMSYVPSMRAVTAWEEQRRLLKYELGQRCVVRCGVGTAAAVRLCVKLGGYCRRCTCTMPY